jgi:chorismate synthase
MLACTVLDFMLLGGRINPDRIDDRPGEYDTEYHPSSPRTDPEEFETSATPTDSPDDE